MRRFAPLLALVALVALAYADALGGTFHFDDSHAIVDNPAIRSLAFAGRYFTDPSTFSVLPQNQSYRPLLLLTYAATATLTRGVWPVAFLAVNALVHLACVLLFWRALRLVARALTVENAETIAWLAAAIFAVHPLFSESVDYVSSRSESLAAALSLAGVLAWLRAREAVNPRRAAAFLGAAAVALALAVLTKIVAAIIPIYLLLLERALPRPVEGGGDERRGFAGTAVARFLVPLAPTVAAALLVSHMTPAFAKQSASHIPRWTWFRSEMPAILHYARLFVWPVGQSADADYPVSQSWGEPPVILSTLVLAATIVFVAIALWRRRRVAAALALGWFLLVLVPASSFVPLAEVTNEHRPYLAATGLCALAAAALLHAPRWLGFATDGEPAERRARLVVIAPVLAVLTLLTVLRNRVWATETSLWADVVASAPTSPRAQMNLGLALMSNGYLDDAEPHLREAVRLSPAYPYAHINLGNLLLARGRTDEARRELDDAVRFGQNLVYSHYYRGLGAEKMNEPADAAARSFEAATRLSPTYADAFYHLALARDRMGVPTEAVVAARRAVELRGSYDDRFLYAYLLLRTKQPRDVAEAGPLLERLARERPSDKRVTTNLDYLHRQSPPVGGAK